MADVRRIEHDGGFLLYFFNERDVADLQRAAAYTVVRDSPSVRKQCGVQYLAPAVSVFEVSSPFLEHKLAMPA
jgi:hypothetical protein